MMIETVTPHIVATVKEMIAAGNEHGFDVPAFDTRTLGEFGGGIKSVFVRFEDHHGRQNRLEVRKLGANYGYEFKHRIAYPKSSGRGTTSEVVKDFGITEGLFNQVAFAAKMIG